MSGETLRKLGNAALAKAKFSKESRGKYTLASVLAGFYVGLGIILIMTIGGLLSAAGSPSTKIVMGVSFGVALSLVIMAGSELFTGNNYIMSTGVLDNRVSWSDAGRVWFYSFIGNFIGSAIVALIFVLAGLTNGATGDFIIKVAGAKMSGEFMPLLARGILCNILVCLAIHCSFKMESETGKLIMIWWCLFAFITSGFEHSIANMTIFSIALFMPHPETISVMGMMNNLIPVTIGNFIGGGIILAGSYFILGKSK
ncbi:formate/nitrite transporter family protein [Oceanirhabdus sp. W0125-5]|uniref:formate/nitrite transporter family protein n=1 Tax=Oceanirhabdus sp. W0125-5 TaxID=2999116 RepID=UPI0022F2E3EF|nr:formate/nitrite transporter family protein [Oceanirhabdus sp. W0125-5]WBW96109.1 formate/nitrite transporter family protein [Oceanirhabdus sp. W0125-5]